MTQLILASGEQHLPQMVLYSSSKANQAFSSWFLGSLEPKFITVWILRWRCGLDLFWDVKLKQTEAESFPQGPGGSLWWSRNVNCSWIWNAVCSVNVSGASMKNMAILLLSALEGWRPVPSAWQNMYPWHGSLWCCFLMDGILMQKGLQRLHCLWLSLAKCEMTWFLLLLPY